MKTALTLVCALAATTALAEDKQLKVGVAGSEPFVQQTTPPTGFSVDTFEALAASMNLEFSLVPVATVDEAIKKVAAGELDLAVGPISVTAERARVVSFTQPYYQAGLSVLATPTQTTLWDRIKPFFSRAFVVGLAVLLIILCLVGALVWFVERKANPAQFPPGFAQGLGAGMWLALVTMTTVGYGDKAPLTTRGRFITGVWMLISMMFASSLTAGIATALTLAQLERPTIDTPADLRGRKVATVSGTTSVEFIQRNGGIVVGVATIEEAVRRLDGGQVDAVVFDRPILQYWLRRHPETQATLSDGSWEVRGYGFALPLGSAMLHPMNVALLDLAESNRLGPVRLSWLGE